MEPSFETQQTDATKTSPAIPIAIIVGFAMIAVAIFFTSSNEPTETVTVVEADEEVIIESGTPRTIDETDYIKGNPNAPIMIIEYSDYECPYCKEYHSTMNSIMEEYGVNGQVGWVFRQFPLTQLHPNAAKISEAALCVGELGGNDAFWTFTDTLFEERAFDAPTNVTRLPQYALDAGISQLDFANCIDERRNQEAVLASAEEAFRIGARGTPYSVVIVGDQQAVINGAQPYAVVKDILDTLISQLEGTETPTPTTTE
tara:strand:+ start:240 stop:1013 length:774 start_codon:yes stop_codon:yes gene_type:complete